MNVFVLLRFAVKGGVYIFSAGEQDSIVILGAHAGRISGRYQFNFARLRARRQESLEIRRLHASGFLLFGN